MVSDIILDLVNTFRGIRSEKFPKFPVLYENNQEKN